MVARIPDGQDQFVGIFDLDGFGYSNMDMVAVKALVRLLELAFPERMGAVYIINEGWVFWAMYVHSFRAAMSS